jgi:hypothetical protein
VSAPSFYLQSENQWGFVYGAPGYFLFRDAFTLPAVGSATTVRTTNPGQFVLGNTVQSVVGQLVITSISTEQWPATVTSNTVPWWNVAFQNTGAAGNAAPGSVAAAGSVIVDPSPGASAWSQFGQQPDYVDPSPQQELAIGTLTSSDSVVYAMWQNRDHFVVSDNAGAQWTTANPTPTSPFVGTATLNADCAATGELFLGSAKRGTPVTNTGIFRSDDHGLTWTQIHDSSGIFQPATPCIISVSGHKVWFAEQTASDTFTLSRCNYDGSSVESLGSCTTGFGFVVLRAFSDTLCLASVNAASTTGKHFLIDSSLHDITPNTSSSYNGWDAIALSSTVFLAVGNFDSNSYVYRSSDAGTSWALARNFSPTEGFANGTTDSYYMIDCDPVDRDLVYLLGYANTDAQQLVWISTDGGLTWSSIVNAAEPRTASGEWAIFNPGGIRARSQPAPRVAVPSRLATIVG